MVGLFKKGPKDEFRKLVKNKKFDKALEFGIDLLKSRPGDHDLLFMLGAIYNMKDDHQNSLKYLNQMLEIAIFDVEALTLKARSHFELGQTLLAIDACNRVKELEPNNKKILKILEKIESENK